MNDITQRLIAHNSCGCGCSSDTRRLISEAADEIERLRSWKQEATIVLDEWDAVAARALDGVKNLGQSKAWIVGAELGRLEAENARLRGELENVQRDRMAGIQVERLRALITEWADSEDADAEAVASNAPFTGPKRMRALDRKVDAYYALRKEAGR
jgi:hypothetical protein